MAAALDEVLKRGVDAVAAALAAAAPPGPVYAVGLIGTGEEELDPGVPCIYVLNRIARRVGERPPPWPVTDDFAVFCLDEGIGDELLENLRFSASPNAAARLAERGLLPADVRALPGLPR